MGGVLLYLDQARQFELDLAVTVPGERLPERWC